MRIAEDYMQREAWRWPAYLTPEKKAGNLLRNGSFEIQGDNQDWTTKSWRKNAEAATIAEGLAQDGNRSAFVQAAIADDAFFAQEVAVRPNTNYLLSGWVKTKGVTLVEKIRNVGANLSVHGVFAEHSLSVTGDSDWNYVVLQFNSGPLTKVQALARLGFNNSTCTGKAWFDDLCLIEDPWVPPSSTK